MIKATQASERQPYDVVRSALKEVELDSSRRVELDDYVDVRVGEVNLWMGQCNITRIPADSVAHIQSPWNSRGARPE